MDARDEIVQSFDSYATYLNMKDNFKQEDNHRRGGFRSFRTQEYPHTLGTCTDFHSGMYKQLEGQPTFSPPAFGPPRLPGDYFAPWQCTLAEELPPMASTAYREEVDREDFEETVDQTGLIHKTRGTQSERRLFPKEPPPRSLDYLRAHLPETASSQRPKIQTVKIQNLIKSPVHHQLAEVRLQRVLLEEAILKHSRDMDLMERCRGPMDKWYTLRTPQFFYEARKYNKSMRTRSKSKPWVP